MIPLVLLALLLLPGVARAQWAVIDAANLKANTFNGLQNMVTAAQTTISAANSVLDVTTLGDIVLSANYAADMEELAQLIVDGQALMAEVETIRATLTVLFDLETAPRSMSALEVRLGEIRQTMYKANCYALQTQTLVTSTLRAVQHLVRLIDGVGRFVGAMQARQTLTQVDGTLAQIMATMQLQTAAWQRTDTLERMTQPLIDRSLANITEAVMADHPRRALR